MNATEFEQALLNERQTRRCELRVNRATRWFKNMRFLETIHQEIAVLQTSKRAENLPTTFNKLDEVLV